jgi:hypothetical protein
MRHIVRLIPATAVLLSSWPAFANCGDGNLTALNFTRDGINLFLLSTYAANFDQTNGQLHLKITTYDKSVAKVSQHKYSVAGTLQIASP